MKYSILQNRSHENETDKQKSLFRRINILDVFLVLVLVAILLLLATFFFDISIFGIGGEERDITYTVELDGLTPEFLARVKKGDLVYDAAGKAVAGFVTDIKTADSVRYTYNEESGFIEKVVLPADADGKIPQTVQITVRASARYDEGAGYSVNGARIVSGNNIELCFSGYTGVGKCIAVSVINTNGGGN